MTEDRDKWRKYVHGVANPRNGTRTAKESIPLRLQCNAFTYQVAGVAQRDWLRAAGRQQLRMLDDLGM